MSTDPDQIRREIERTRNELGGDVDALTDKVNPRRIAGQRVERARGAVRTMRGKVMGTTSEAASSAPQMVRAQTQGSPLAAGLIAFGAGLLVSSLLPPSQQERRIAGQVKDKATEHSEEIKQQVTESTQQVRENLREPAQQAAESVKSTAAEGASAVQEQGRSAAQDVRR